MRQIALLFILNACQKNIIHNSQSTNPANSARTHKHAPKPPTARAPYSASHLRYAIIKPITIFNPLQNPARHIFSHTPKSPCSNRLARTQNQPNLRQILKNLENFKKINHQNLKNLENLKM